MAFGNTYGLDEDGKPKPPAPETNEVKRPVTVRPAAPKKPVIDDAYKRRVLTALNRGEDLSDADRRWVEKEYGFGTLRRFGSSVTAVDGQSTGGQSPYWARRQGPAWEGVTVQVPQLGVQPEAETKIIMDQAGREMEVPRDARVLGPREGGVRVELEGNLPANTTALTPYFGSGLPLVPSIVNTRFPLPPPSSVKSDDPTRRFSPTFNEWFLGRGAPTNEEWTQLKGEDAKNFFEQYYRSPRFAEMYARQWDQAPWYERIGTMPRQFMGEALARRVRNAELRYFPDGGPALPAGTSYAVAPHGISFENQFPNAGALIGRPNAEHVVAAPHNDDMVYQTLTTDPTFTGPAQGGIMGHEFGHLGFDDIMPKWQQDYIVANQLPSKGSWGDHARSPRETRADIVSIRHLAHRLGIYNPMAETFDASHLRKLQGLDPQYSGFSSKLARLLTVYKPEFLIWMMNNVAQNPETNNVPDNYA